MTEVSAPPLPFDPALQVLPYDPFDPAFHSDPYATYRELRATGPAVRSPAGVVSVLGFKAISDLLRDPRFGRGDGPGVQDTYIPTPEGLQRAVMFMDPPDHTRVRSLVNKAFTPRAVEGVRPKAEKFAAELFAKARAESGGNPVDLLDAVMRPLGAYVLNEFVGVPEKYLERCIQFANDAGRGLDPSFTLSAAELAARVAARDGYVEISMELIEDRRARPRQDLVSELVQVEQGGDKLTEIEMLTTVANLFLAGFSATPALLGLSALALLRHPDQMTWYRENPDRVVTSVEELIRYDGVVQLANRTVLEPAEVCGFEVSPGDEVFLLLGAANRDDEVFPDAARLDLSRPASRNLAFGHGIHFCISVPLAKLVNEVVLTELSRFETELAVENPRTNGAVAVRSLAELPVVLGPYRG